MKSAYDVERRISRDGHVVYAITHSQEGLFEVVEIHPTKAGAMDDLHARRKDEREQRKQNKKSCK